jgi:hypothetical protein
MQDPAAGYNEQKARADRNESRVKLLAALVAAVGAIATTFGIVWGQTAKKADVATGRADAGTEQIKQIEAQNQELRNQLAEAQKTIEELRASPGAADSSPVPSGDATSSTLRREGTFKLLESKSADLDAPFNDPQWGIVQDNGVRDLEWRPYGNLTIGKPFTGASAVPTQFKLIGSSEPSEDDCRNITDYSSKEIDLANVKTGTYFCWITSEDRYAVLKVAAMTKDYSSLTMNAKVFKKSGD